MTWLITGGCGFVGTNLADALLSQGHSVVLLDNLSRVGSKQNLEWLRKRHGQEWRFEEKDVRNADTVNKLVSEVKPRALAHLAGQVAMTTSIANPRLDFEVNALGTLNILEGVRLNSPNTIVLYSSTNKVYGDLGWVKYEEHDTRYVAVDYPNGFDETIPLAFHSPYGCSKGAADQYVQDYARMFGIRSVVFRHSSMYGGRQFATFDQGWIGWFCTKAIETERAQELKSKPPMFTISGNGKQVRDVLYADDVTKLYIAAIECISSISGQAFNIGGGLGNSLSLLELFDILERRLQIRLSYEGIPTRKSDQKVFIADINRITTATGWTPATRCTEGIARILDWSRQVRD